MLCPGVDLLFNLVANLVFIGSCYYSVVVTYRITDCAVNFGVRVGGASFKRRDPAEKANDNCSTEHGSWS
jgi:hypothetical protein